MKMKLMLLVFAFALASIPTFAQQTRQPQNRGAAAPGTAGQQRPAPPQVRQPQNAPPQRGVVQQAPRQTPPAMRAPTQTPRSGYYGGPAPRTTPRYYGTQRPYGPRPTPYGSRYFGHGGWRSLIVVSGWWGYWYSGAWYPVYQYYPPYYPIYVGGGYGVSGLKFDLGLLPRGERELAKRGIVVVDGAEVGTVARFEGHLHSALPLMPGTHEVSVFLEDGRPPMDTTFSVQPGRITHISLRFDPVGPPPQDQP